MYYATAKPLRRRRLSAARAKIAVPNSSTLVGKGTAETLLV